MFCSDLPDSDPETRIRKQESYLEVILGIINQRIRKRQIVQLTEVNHQGE